MHQHQKKKMKKQYMHLRNDERLTHLKIDLLATCTHSMCSK